MPDPITDAFEAGYAAGRKDMLAENARLKGIVGTLAAALRIAKRIKSAGYYDARQMDVSESLAMMIEENAK